MAQYRQSGVVFGSRGHDLLNGASDHVSVGVRAGGAPHKSARPRRSARSDKARRFSIGAVIVVLSVALLITVLAYYYLSSENKDINTYGSLDDDLKNDSDFLLNVTRTDPNKVLNFGKGSVTHGRDSRYWDRDDRRRDEGYNEDTVDNSSVGTDKGNVPVRVKNDNKSSLENNRKVPERGLYNEAGRNELKKYEAEYEASLKNVAHSINDNGNRNQLTHNEHIGLQNDAVDIEDEYDDGIDLNDARMGDDDETGHDQNYSIVKNLQDQDDRETSRIQGVKIKDQSTAEENDKVSANLFEDLSLRSKDFHKESANSQHVTENRSPPEKPRSYPKGRSKRHKYSGNSCEMKLLNSTAQLVEPLESRKFVRFSLQYTEWEENPIGQENWEPRFAGHQSLQEREESFLAHDNKINCGFVKGPKGSPSTGFDLSEDDTKYISKCHIAVISCIFGNSDRLRTPTGKTVTRLSRKNVCFVMFMDEVTLKTLASEGHMPDTMGFIGLWKIVVVKNLPFTDMRRVGKIPKLLPHRLFPSARYSIWLDSKLRLQRDPLLILEYFLWRKGHEYAISNHYDRHCVWEEVAQNKKLNKYDHTVIDHQFEFYQSDGLKRFNASDLSKLLPSNVPEGSFIARAHTPMSNLFSCLWFNEVDRFTPRDQLSFAYTHQKLIRMNPGKPFHLNMFKDCERRAIAKLFRHRAEEKRNLSVEGV